MNGGASVSFMDEPLLRILLPVTVFKQSTNVLISYFQDEGSSVLVPRINFLD